MKISLRLLRVLIVWFLLVSIGGIPLAFATDAFRIGLVLDKGGKDDRSFNYAALEGLRRAEKEINASIKYVEATDDNAFETLLRSFAQKKFDLIFAIGVSQAEALKKIANQFKDRKFVIVDTEVDAPNIKSLVFDEHEGAFLVGAIAALTSKTGRVGFIGGMDIPIIRRFELGYQAGARHIKSDIKVTSNFIGITADSWNNPAKAKELAISQYNLGSDVIFSAAGASGAGLFDAAEEKQKFAIGVDLNQNWVKPGFVLTSMVKKIDEAVFRVSKDASEGKFVAGTQRFGLKDKGVDYSIDSYNEKLIPAAVRMKVEKLKADIIVQKLKVPDYYKLRK